MQRTQCNRGWVGRGRIARAAFAVIALLLQSLAPVSIMPPRGHAVHFAHAHHGDPHAGHHKGGKPAETPSCPVCYALLAGGQSLEAAAPALRAAIFNYAPPPPPSIEAPASPPPTRARARAPPLRA